MVEPTAMNASVAPSGAIETAAAPCDSSPTICTGDSDFLELVLGESGEKIQACYQCHKCASGCPVASETDYTPDKLIRLIQLGEKEKALGAKHLQTCVACYTCSARCPNNINGARLVEALKHIAYKEGIPPAKPAVKAFHDTFLMSVRHFGRVNEAELMGIYSLKAGFDWFTILKSPVMFLNGRLKLWGGRIRGLKRFRKLFDRRAVQLNASAKEKNREGSAHGN